MQACSRLTQLEDDGFWINAARFPGCGKSMQACSRLTQLENDVNEL
jgi:hypothetical protein